MILLFCRTYFGRYCDVWINRTDTILQLKNKIHEQFGAPVDKIVLEYGYGDEKRIVLDNDKLICDYGISHEYTIFVFVRLGK